ARAAEAPAPATKKSLQSPSIALPPVTLRLSCPASPQYARLVAKTRSALTPPPAEDSTTGPAVDHAIDWVYFVAGGVAAVWLAWVLVRQSFTFGWWQILFVVLFWGALAYLVLPRLHRILTSIYV